MTIFIFRRKGNGDLQIFCPAEVIREQGRRITFQTREWIPPALDSHYYVKVEGQDRQRDTFAEIFVYKHPSLEPPYTYTVECLQEWSPPEKDEDNQNSELSAPKVETIENEDNAIDPSSA